MNKRLSNYCSVLLIIATVIVVAYRIIFSSEKIILHWDFAGNITSYGSRFALIILPIIAFILYLVLNNYKSHPYDLLLPSRKKVIENDFNQRKLIQYIDTINPLISLLIFYVTMCSAQYLPLKAFLLYAVVIGIIVKFTLVLRSLIRKH